MSSGPAGGAVRFRRSSRSKAEAPALCDAYLTGEILLVEPGVALYEFANAMRFIDELNTEQVQLAVESLFAFPIRWVQPT